MRPPTRIRWGLALLGGFLAEAGIFAVMPFALQFGEHAPLYVIPPTCVIMTFVFGFWVGRRAGSRFVLHGAIVGAVAALIYIGLTIGKTLPLAYFVSHFLKVLGGMAGGWVAGRTVRQDAGSNIEPAESVTP
jgi:putative membrane protein (TIGR04086 family)